MFTRCRAQVDYGRYYDWCLEDSCACDTGGDCECLCTAISAFADECARVGLPVRWRSQHVCPMQCEYGQVGV